MKTRTMKTIFILLVVGLNLPLIWNCGPKKADEPVNTAVYAGNFGFYSNGPLNVTEGGATASFAVKLTQAPVHDMVISISDPSGQLIPFPSQIVFSSSNWSYMQTVTVSAFDDTIVNGTRVSTLNLSITSTQAEFAGLTVPSVSATITDNDSPGVSVLVTGTDTFIDENGLIDSVFISLSQAPAQDVVVTFSNPDPCRITINPTQVRFTSSNWQSLVEVKFSAFDDILLQPVLQTYTIGAVTSSVSTLYNNLNVPFSLTVQDNDSLIYVNNKAAGLNNGHSWQNAYTDLQTALTKAASLTPIPAAPVQIWVAYGNYYPAAAGQCH